MLTINFQDCVILDVSDENAFTQVSDEETGTKVWEELDSSKS